MSDKFSSTMATYAKYASRFAAQFEKRLMTDELDKFLKSLPAGGRILDAGCGAGRDSAYMMKHGFRVLGVDLSAELLAEAKKMHPEVPTQKMSLTRLDLPNGSFDGIWCKATLLHIDRIEVPQVLAGFGRILKSGGQLFLQTKAGEGEGEQPTPFDTTLTRYFTFFGLTEIKNLVKNAGFEISQSYIFNGQKRNSNSRDQDWVVVFARKK